MVPDVETRAIRLHHHGWVGAGVNVSMRPRYCSLKVFRIFKSNSGSVQDKNSKKKLRENFFFFNSPPTVDDDICRNWTYANIVRGFTKLWRLILLTFPWISHLIWGEFRQKRLGKKHKTLKTHEQPSWFLLTVRHSRVRVNVSAPPPPYRTCSSTRSYGQFYEIYCYCLPQSPVFTRF